MIEKIQLSSWQDFKNLLNSKKLWLQYARLNKQYYVFIVDTSILYFNLIDISDPRNEEQIDFEDNYKDTANRPLNLSESSTTSIFGGENCWGIVPADDPSGCIEWQFGYDLYFNKMYAIIKDAEWVEGETTGDYVTVSIWMPTEEGDVHVSDYSGKIPCWGNQPSGWMQGTGAGKLLAGLKLRVTYIKGPSTTNSIRRFVVIPEFLI